MKNFLYISLTILIASLPIFSQEAEQIEQKKEELVSIRQEISGLEDELSKKSEREKESYEALDNYNKQAYLLNKIINKLRKEEAAQQKEINKLSKQIKSIEKETKQLRDNYAKYVVALYKKGSYNELESVVNAKSFHQAVVRIQYLRKFSEKRKEDLQELKSKKKELSEAKTKLEKEKREKALLVSEKKTDELQLNAKLDERKKVLASIREDKEQLQTTLTVKRRSQEQIRLIIAKLVDEAERKRKEEELRRRQMLASKEGKILNEETLNEASNSDYDYSLNTSKFSSFSELKGDMIWPIHNGKIVKGFGKTRNTELNTVTLNYGVDISAQNDLNVRCVADGVISAIDWLPGYGSVIIISHQGEYRTVYSHLSEIFVEEGDEVKTGKVIAKIGESVEGKVLHFEIWSSRENINPENWLAQK
ncbi:peptidoglycan DD-metalloendopeptidase family protein [bacterium BMS3Abin03]|nr:peptidoglycan DD-metalloendopeptidase family protein [bacterium BMS3Abin03]